MSYTAENLANIKRDGNMESYIALARNMVASLESAKITYDEQGKDSVSFAHLYGRVGIEVETAEPRAYAQISYGDWEKSWMVASFDNDQSRAVAFARTALANKLIEDGQELLAKFRIRLAALEGASA